MKKRVELWLWFFHDDLTEKLRVSRHRMSAEDAEATYPGAWRVPGSMEVAEVEVAQDEQLGHALDSWVRGGSAEKRA